MRSCRVRDSTGWISQMRILSLLRLFRFITAIPSIIFSWRRPWRRERISLPRTRMCTPRHSVRDLLGSCCLVIADGRGCADQAGSDRSDGALASGHVPGERRRLRWRARTDEWGKITHLTPTRTASPGIARTVCRRHTVAVSTSRINKGMMSTGTCLPVCCS